eukprot:2025900-Amphidinium_carterae.1
MGGTVRAVVLQVNQLDLMMTKVCPRLKRLVASLASSEFKRGTETYHISNYHIFVEGRTRCNM